MTSKFYGQYPAFAATFYKDVANAIRYVNTNPVGAAHLLQSDADGTPTWRQFEQWLSVSGLTYTTRPLGLMRYASFMNRIGMIAKQPSSWRQLVFPPVYPTNGS